MIEKTREKTHGSGQRTDHEKTETRRENGARTDRRLAYLQREVLLRRDTHIVMDDWTRLFERAEAYDCDRTAITDRLDTIRDDRA